MECNNFRCFHNQYSNCRKEKIELDDDGSCIHATNNVYDETELLNRIDELECELREADDKIQELEDETNFN